MKIYVFPFLFDFITFLVLFRLADATGREMHLSNEQAGSLIVVYSIAYLASCIVAARLLNRDNARTLLIAAVCGMLLITVPLCLVATLAPTLALVALLGIAVAMAFNSFQTFMRGEAAPGSLGRVIGRYTISWSTGIGCGYLLGGIILDRGGSIALAALCAIACLTVLAMILTHSPRDLTEDSADSAIETSQPHQAPVDLRYVLVGWSLCFSANFNIRPIGTFIPKLYSEHGRPAAIAGILLCLLFVFEGLGGYGARHLRHWLYRPGPLLAAQLLVVAALGALWLAPSFPVTLCTMVLLGTLYGFIFFSCLFYVSNDAHSSRNVGINEAMVGIGNILGVVVSEVCMRYFHYERAYFPVAMAVTLGIMALQVAWLRRGMMPAGAIAVGDEAGKADLLGFAEI